MGLHDRRRPSLLTRATNPDNVQRNLIALWTVVIFWNELALFFYSVRGCNWPADTSKHSSHVLVISDPQVKNPTIAPSWTSSPLSAFQHYVFELYLRRSWRVASRLEPNHVIFLGDMTASGRRAHSDKEYQLYYESFRNIFQVRNQNMKLHFLPGNNDVGLNMQPKKSQAARRRYHKYFGEFDQVITVQNHTLVLIDAPGLVEEDNKRASHGKNLGQNYEPVKDGPMDFVTSMDPGTTAHPTILFTHIPLSRPDTVTCGALREHGAIRRGAGTGYQNMIGKKASAFLIDRIKPSAIFSGDDRDFCEYIHHVPVGEPVREVTVKSFSLARGIRKPGFHLLTLYSPTPSSAATHSDMPCFLPDQHMVNTYIYIPACLISILLLIMCNLRQPRRQHSLLTNKSLNLDLPLSSVPAAWSPAAPPMSPQPSPLGTLSPGIRTPIPNSSSKTYAAASVRRASMRSPSPLPTPLPSPPLDRLGEEDDELYPVQYAARQGEPPNQFLHTDHHDEEDHSAPLSTLSAYFPAPKSKDSARYMDQGSRLPWSCSFVFAGRRRRITIPASPSRILLMGRQIIWEFLRDIAKGRRGGNESLARDILMDCIVVFAGAAGWWIFLAWIFS